jgi:hypothetical protein
MHFFAKHDSPAQDLKIRSSVMHTVGTGRTVRVCCALALALGVALIASPAQAGFIQDFSGNTAPQKLDAKNQGVNSTVNFAVLSLEVDKDGNLKDKTDPWGTGLKGFAAKFVAIQGNGSGPLDTTATYLYLYQVTNNEPATAADTISSERLILPKGVTANDITSFGYFDTLGLSDTFGGVAGVPVDAGPNFFGNTRSPGDPAVANVTVNGPGVAALAAGSFVKPTTVTIVEAKNQPTVFTTRWSTPLAPQQRSTIYGFTTFLDPQFSTATVAGTGPGFNGVVVPTGMAPAPMPNPFKPAPEASSLMLAGSAIVSLALVRFRRYLCRPKPA